MDQTFHALSDPTRRELLSQIARHPDSNVGDLAANFDMSLNAVSKHLKVLESAKLISRKKQGRQYHFRMIDDSLTEAEAWMEQIKDFWQARLDALEAVIMSKRKNSRKTKTKPSE